MGSGRPLRRWALGFLFESPNIPVPSGLPHRDTPGTSPQTPQTNFLQRRRCAEQRAGARAGEMGSFDSAPQGDEELKYWEMGGGWPSRTTSPQGLARGNLWALMVPTARAGQAGRGIPYTSGSRVSGLGGPVLPAVPGILPPARATRAHNAPVGWPWCSGARRRRLLLQRGAAGHQHPTPVRSPAAFRSTSCSCAAGATRAPDVTAPALVPAPPSPGVRPCACARSAPAPPPRAGRLPGDC